MNKLIINVYTTKQISSLDEDLRVCLTPIEYDVPFEMYRQDYLYKGIKFTIENCRYDLDNDRWIYETKPAYIIPEYHK